MCEDSVCDVVVVGAGLSGLSAARYLKQRNSQLSIKVLEAKGAFTVHFYSWCITVYQL